MSKIKDTDYAYSVAKVRAAETRLLDRMKLQRMAEAANAEEALKILKENGYEGESAEEMLAAERTKTYAFLRDISPSREVFDIFLVKNDYHNVKVLLKAEFLGENYDFLLTDSGRYPVQLVKNAVESRVMGQLPQVMQDAVARAINLYEKTADPQLCDLELDCAAYCEMQQMAQATKSAYVKDIVATMADLVNIKSVVRVRRMGKGTDFLLRALVSGGKIKEQELAREGLERLSKLLQGTPYEVLSDFEDNLSELEKQADNFLIRYIKRAKYVTFGMEPLVAYLMAKENEIKLARIILTGKKNNLPAEMIKERLRESYV